MDNDLLINILQDNNLKVTPQRVALLETFMVLNNHPSTENIKDYIRENHPHIALGTIYKILDAFKLHNIVKKVFTDDGVTRFDSVVVQHHHLYCSDSERIEDYYDKKLDAILKDYFKRKKIKGFKIETMKLQIMGKFTEERKDWKNK